MLRFYITEILHARRGDPENNLKPDINKLKNKLEKGTHQIYSK
jgi:hypothetical protein